MNLAHTHTHKRRKNNKKDEKPWYNLMNNVIYEQPMGGKFEK